MKEGIACIYGDSWGSRRPYGNVIRRSFRGLYVVGFRVVRLTTPAPTRTADPVSCAPEATPDRGTGPGVPAVAALDACADASSRSLSGSPCSRSRLSQLLSQLRTVGRDGSSAVGYGGRCDS